LLKRLLCGTGSKKRPKRVLVRYATSEKVERVKVAGQATKNTKADVMNQSQIIISAAFLTPLSGILMQEENKCL